MIYLKRGSAFRHGLPPVLPNADLLLLRIFEMQLNIVEFLVFLAMMIQWL